MGDTGKWDRQAGEMEKIKGPLMEARERSKGNPACGSPVAA